MERKIARLVPDLPPIEKAYGYFVTFHMLNKAQRELGNRVTTFHPQRRMAETHPGNDTVSVPVTKLAEFSLGLRLSSKLGEYDVVHSHARVGLPYAFFTSRGPPVVVHLHGLPYHFTDSISGPRVDGRAKIHDLRALFTYSSMLGCADHVITYCKGLADKVVELFDLDLGSVSWIDNGIDPSLFRTMEEGEVDVNFKGSPVILYVGRLSAVKGVYTLLRSLPNLVESLPEIRVVFLGCEAQPLIDSELRGNVTFIPHVPHRNVAAYYRAADAHVALTQTYGYQKTVLESLACGVPVIATDNPDNRYVAGRAGVYIDPLNNNQLSDAVAQIAGETRLKQRAIRNSKRIRERFSWRKTAERIEAVYDHLL